ncbi:MAG: serine/threonine protein kinase [Desulfovibrionaceae bacterium]|nr:serine/threonine protein kinase [Desulfovibrionaceae bacterium]
MRESARDLLRQYDKKFPLKHAGEIYADTTDIVRIGYGDVIELAGLHYLVLRDEIERRFGVEDVKYWVKRCRCLETNQSKILKLVFHETFPQKFGDAEILCYRSEQKEARILDMVRGDARFMQGFSAPDAAGNLVRVLDVIRGKRLDLTVEDIDADHETYFHDHLPGLLRDWAGACRAIASLHSRDEKHGDIRRDHLWIDYKSGGYTWIDFDFTFDCVESPFGLDILGLGNSLVFLAGKADLTPGVIAETFGERALDSLCPQDFSLFFRNRLVNLRTIYPYVPQSLNNVLMHFSAASEVFYESVDELLGDLMPAVEDIDRA